MLIELVWQQQFYFIFLNMSEPFQAVAGPGTEAGASSWWKTPRQQPCSLSQILTLRLQMHNLKMK